MACGVKGYVRRDCKGGKCEVENVKFDVKVEKFKCEFKDVKFEVKNMWN